MKVEVEAPRLLGMQRVNLKWGKQVVEKKRRETRKNIQGAGREINCDKDSFSLNKKAPHWIVCFQPPQRTGYLPGVLKGKNVNLMRGHGGGDSSEEKIQEKCDCKANSEW